MAYPMNPENGGQTATAARPAFSGLFGWDPFRSFLSAAAQSDLSISRTEKGYAVEVPVAGYSPDQIEVTAKDGVITISGKNDRHTFTRTLVLPDEIDEDSIKARVEHGMLTLTLQRHPEAQPKKIPIEVSK